MIPSTIPSRPDRRVLLVGNPGVVHVGAHLANAAATLGIPARLVDLTAARSPHRWIDRLYWHLRGHRPANLRRFGESVVAACRVYRPAALLATGIVPLEAATLRQIRGLDIAICNFLTDDPFNPAHRAPWFLEALPEYDCIFSPRRANMGDLRAAGCRDVTYLPFAYAPEIHFPEPPSGRTDPSVPPPDVFFAGEADRDRVPYMAALLAAGWKLALYGGSWDRYRETRAAALGHVGPATVRQAAARAKVSVCLVRRANRDGHSMRSFELPAMRACLAAEDTAEHRELFGPPGECAQFFRSAEELLTLVERLSGDAAERSRLAEACYHRICRGANTYGDRLMAMLDRAQAIRGEACAWEAGRAACKP